MSSTLSIHRFRLFAVCAVLVAFIIAVSSTSRFVRGSLLDDHVLTIADTNRDGVFSVGEMRRALTNMIRAFATNDLAYDLNGSGTVDRADLTLLIRSIRAFLTAVCPNATIEPGEQCDDGNATNNDSCTNLCKISVATNADSTCKKQDQYFESTHGGCHNLATNITWSSLQTNVQNQQAALTLCENLTSNGFTDWSLPTAIQITDVALRYAPEYFDFKTNQLFWSSSLSSGSGVIANLSNTSQFIGNRFASYPVVCIRSLACGNEVQEGTEECDDGNDVDTDACTNACRLSFCGDGFEQEGEECDDGNDVDTDACTTECRDPVCSDGFTQRPEQCDDANQNTGDGCTPICSVETGFSCTGSPSRCTRNPICGNRVVEQGEQCDSTSGCSTITCQFLIGCGNGALANTEQCDDGNEANDDGCSNQCVVENAPDGLSLAWTLEPAIPTSVREFATTSALGKMWVIGGYNPAGGLSDKVYATSDGKTWTPMGNLPYAVYAASAIEWNGELWVVGGTTCGSQASCHIHRTLHTTDGISWLEGPALPASLNVYKHSLYILGGKLFISTQTIHSLASATSSWQAAGSAYGSSTVSFLGRAWMLNGRSVVSAEGATGWQQMSILPAWLTTQSFVVSPGMLVVHGKYLLAIGNSPSLGATVQQPNCFKTVLSSIDGIHWGTSFVSPCWQPMRDHTILSFKQRLWMFGEVFDSGKLYSTDVQGSFLICGNGSKEGDEECDDGDDLNTNACTNRCRLAACRDGFTQGAEQCDDGNDVDADACSNSCMLPVSGNTCLHSGLDAYWKFDETGGTRIAAFGNFPLTETSGPIGSTAGIIGQATAGPQAHILRNTNSVITNANRSFTIAQWMKLQNIGSAITSYATVGTNQAFSWYIGYATSSMKRFYFNVGNTRVIANNFGQIGTGQWYFVVGTYDAATHTMKLSVNGGTPNTAIQSGAIPSGAGVFTTANGGGDYFDETGIWGRVLTQAEIQGLYRNGAGLDFSQFGTCN